MKIIIIGSGLMGRAIAFDLSSFSRFNEIAIADKNEESLDSANIFLKNKDINFLNIDIENKKELKNQFYNFDIAISAVPYKYNLYLSKISIQTKTHFLDLGGNNDIVKSQRELFSEAKNNKVLIIPDCGLAPGMTSTITREIVEYFDRLDFVKIRVGGLPVNPKSPLNYQIVFSPNGLINEYVEDAIVLDHGKILTKKSMSDIEKISFPKPFGNMEAFSTSGGCSTLPYTYKDKIGYLDYKTVRYPGHCEKFKILLDLGFADEKEYKVKGEKIVPRDFFAKLLLKSLLHNEKDVVLLKVLSGGENMHLEYTMVDYYDEKNHITSMMRTTGYPVSIIAQMIERGIIQDSGVFCCEEVVPCTPFFKELRKRNIDIKKEILEL
jgi:lysine 6-dehydrogenase